MDHENYSSDPFFMTPTRISLPILNRRLSLSAKSFKPNRPAKKKLAWLSLQGPIFGAEEATSVKSVGKGLGKDETVAWELFSPMERLLAVAIIGAAEKEGIKRKQIKRLERSVKIRDEVLQNMQKKLEKLCELMNSSFEKPFINFLRSSYESNKFKDFTFDMKENDIPLSFAKENGLELSKSEMFQTGTPNVGEPEERRMSDLSDFSRSSSSVDLQWSTLAEEQQLYNLRKECEEKDTIIKELNAEVHSSSIAESKRITELEDIIRHKNLIITKLKKDMLVLEQKVIQLTREKRRHSMSSITEKKYPALLPNILYDMSSSGSSSSSDSDSPIQQKAQQRKSITKNNKFQTSKSMKSRSVISPVKATPSASSSQKRAASSSVETKRRSRPTSHESKIGASHKRWV